MKPTLIETIFTRPSEQSMWLSLITLAAAFAILLSLPACATVKVRVPLGAEERYGAIDVGMTYYPPRDFEKQFYDLSSSLPSKLPTWVKLPENPFRFPAEALTDKR